MPAGRVVFGERIRKLRQKRKWSQEKLAEESGLHPTYVSGIERGKRDVGLESILKLARALKVDPGKLLKGIR